MQKQVDQRVPLLRMDKNSKVIFEKLINNIVAFAVSEDAYKILKKFYPVSDENEILKRQETIKKYFSTFADRNPEMIRDLIRKSLKIKINTEKVINRIIVTDNAEDYKLIKSVINICPSAMISSKDDLEVLLRTYDIVLFYSREVQCSIVNHDVLILDDLRVEYIIPDIILRELRENMDSLNAIGSLIEMLPEEVFMDTFNLNMIRNALLDKELIEIEMKIKKLQSLDDIILNLLEEANKNIINKAEQYEIRLRGSELLEAFIKGSESLSEIMKGLEDIKALIDEEALKIEERISKILGDLEEDLVIRTYPLRIKDTHYKKLKEKSLRNLSKALYDRALVIVKRLIHQIKLLNDLIEHIKFLDAMLALYIYITAMGEWCFPRVFKGGIGFIKGRNPFLQDPQPISYVIGKIPKDSPFKVMESSVTLLTGANSGGKTTLLETVLIFQILAQAGFPVPAKDAWFDVVDIIRYYKGARKSLSAGAFEHSLKSLVSLITARGKKLILIDELAESMTEPGAAATIISEIIRILKDQGDYCILVTHLGREILLRLEDIRVDGIEAKGLDSNFRLIVNRQPIFGKIGKSTPELIVKKLYSIEKSKKRRLIYEKILSAFEQ